ncbi:MAG: hypothetical protein MJA31_18510 [Clostridia bacterium]|nr:hypothetical protein [Clostridia bacterium]
MWIPAIISAIILIITIVVLTYLQKTEKIKENDKISKRLNILGLYIPILVILSNFAYAKTDTTQECMIVLMGLFVCFFIGIFIERKSCKSPCNLILLAISWIIGIAIILYIYKFMLIVKITFILSQFILLLIIAGRGKWKVYILGFIILIGITFMVDKYENVYFNNKVERTAINYVKEAGYDITDEDTILIFSGANRGENIVVWINRLEEQPLRLKRHLNLTYYEGKIIKFEDESNKY